MSFLIESLLRSTQLNNYQKQVAWDYLCPSSGILYCALLTNQSILFDSTWQYAYTESINTNEICIVFSLWGKERSIPLLPTKNASLIVINSNRNLLLTQFPQYTKPLCPSVFTHYRLLPSLTCSFASAMVSSPSSIESYLWHKATSPISLLPILKARKRRNKRCP